MLMVTMRPHQLIPGLQRLVDAARLYRRQPSFPEASIVLHRAIDKIRDMLDASFDDPGLQEACRRMLYLCEEIAHDLKVSDLRGTAATPNRTRAADLCGTLMDLANVLISTLQTDVRTISDSDAHSRVKLTNASRPVHASIGPRTTARIEGAGRSAPEVCRP